MPPANSRRTVAALVLVVFTVTASLFAPTGSPLAPVPVAADPISDKREEARQIADQLHELETTAGKLAEDYNDAVLKQQELQVQVDATTKSVDEANTALEATRAKVADFAVDAYVRGGTEVQTPSPLKADPNTAAKLEEYANAAIGDPAKLLKQFRKAKGDAEKQIEALEKAKADAAEVAKTVDANAKAAQKAVDDQMALHNRVQGELGELVREEEARREAQTVARPLPAGPAPSGPVPVMGSGGAAAVAAAKTQLGKPYVWGAESPSVGFDCSGLVLWAWKQAGKSLPHSSRAMYSMSTKIPLSQAQPGDLVFYGEGGVSHVALYMGNNQIIHAPNSRSVVNIKPVNYWDAFIGVGRI